MFRVLRDRTFGRLFAAQLVALVGTGLLTVALGLLAYDLAGADAGAVLGTALAIKMIAYVAVAPVISVVADRLPRKVLLVGADAIRAGVALLLPLVDQTWQIYLLVFVLQAASATFTPAFQSMIPQVLPDEADYTRALSLSRLAYDLESLLSPVLAATLLTLMTYNYLFLGTVAGFVGSALLVTTTSLPRGAVADRSAPLLQRITLGARVMAGRPVLRALLAMNMVVAAATALVVVDTVVYVHGSSTGVAVALGCFGGGSMVVALMLPRLPAAFGERRIMLTGAALLPAGLAATTLMVVTDSGPTMQWPLLAVIWSALGAGTSMINTPSARLLRDESDERDRAAVFTAQFSLSHACFLLTYPLAGWVGAQLGQVAAAAASTALATLAALLAARAWPARSAHVAMAVTGRR